MLRRTALLASLPFLLAPALVPAQPGIVTSVASGYAVTTIPLPGGATFAGAFGNQANNPNVVVIYYDDGVNDVIGAVDLVAETVTPLLSDTEFALNFVGGCALIDDDHLVWADNANSGLPGEDVYLATDADNDGFEASEVVSLTSKGLTIDDPTGQADFTGSKIKVIPAGGYAGLAAGDVLIQSADGSAGPSELLAIRGITTGTPSFVPTPGVTNETWFRGTGSLAQHYDGGTAFGPSGSILAGSGLNDFTTARLMAVRDVNTDGQINPLTEANDLGDLATGGLYDLSANTEGRVFLCSGPDIKTAQIDLTSGDVLTAPPLTTTTNLVTTSSPFFFLGGVFLNDPSLPFAPNGDPLTSARLVFADYGGTELYIVRPQAGAAVDDWTTY